MQRFVALDRLRALAVISMVQGHTFTALMAPGSLPEWLMQWHSLVHGLTAPAFLLGAGLAFGIATYPRYEHHRRGGPALWARMRRYGVLILLGYALQLPGASLLAAFRLRGESLAPVLRVGPLHLIALCLGLCQLAALRIRSPRMHAAGAFVVACCITLAAPHIYAAEAGRQVGVPFGAWLDASWGSLFPIFPWAAFAFFGVAAGGLLSVRRAELPRALAWFGPGLLLAASAYTLFRVGVRWSDPKWFWHASPLNVAFRVGLVMCLMGMLHLYARREAPEGSWSTLLARHSLVAYVAHLLLLYGTPFTPNLAYRYGRSLDAPTSALVFVLIMAATMAIVRLWVSGLRERGLQLAWVRAALTAIGLFVLTR